MKCIIGIGNPGKDYEKTRHNVGFRVLEALKKSSKVKETQLIKPKTFVNRTGDEVLKLANRYKLEPQSVLLICDDIYLPLGKMRLRGQGGAGGHKGLLSVIEALGSKEFPRLRIGIGNEKLPKDLSKFVLEPFSKSEEKDLQVILEKSVLICQAWAKEGLTAAMNEMSRL